MYIRAVIAQAGEKIRAIKKVTENKTRAVLLFQGSKIIVITADSGKNIFCDKQRANMFMRRV